jgi:hypothetical protein
MRCIDLATCPHPVDHVMAEPSQVKRILPAVLFEELLGG